MVKIQALISVVSGRLSSKKPMSLVTCRRKNLDKNVI